jgi:hypothetical protein
VYEQPLPVGSHGRGPGAGMARLHGRDLEPVRLHDLRGGVRTGGRSRGLVGLDHVRLGQGVRRNAWWDAPRARKPRGWWRGLCRDRRGVR